MFLELYYRLRSEKIKGGDAQTVVEALADEAQDNPDFYYRVKLDDNFKLVALYWSDSMMIEDYNIFGDVVVFDTTYRTNRYNLICAPIVSTNNHRKNVMFGCAFIADEKVESFEWILENFLKAMKGKYQVSIFTDQDPALSKAIEKVKRM